MIAEEFITSGGSSSVGGSIRATTVEIARKYREKMNDNGYNPADEADDIESIPDLGRFVSNIVTKFIPMVFTTTMGGSHGPPGTFTIGENIEAKIVCSTRYRLS